MSKLFLDESRAVKSPITGVLIDSDSTMYDMTRWRDEDVEGGLKYLLKSYNILHLYEKFCDSYVTPDVIWELDEDMLDEAKLNKTEKLQYQKAKEKAQKEYRIS